MIPFFKPLSILLILAIMLQSCAVYNRNPVSLEDAAKTNKRVLMITSDDKKVRLKRIEHIDGVYYGILNDQYKTKIALDEKNIKALRPLDQAKTNLGNFGFAALGVLVITVVVLAATYDPLGDFGD